MSGILVVGPDGKATLVPEKPADGPRIQKPDVAIEAERQRDLAKQRMHRQLALEMYCSENKSDFLTSEKKMLLDECVELAGYLIEKTGGHQ